MRMVTNVFFKWVSATFLIALPLFIGISSFTPDQLQMEIVAPCAYTLSVVTYTDDGVPSGDVRSAYRAGSADVGKIILSLGDHQNLSKMGFSFVTDPGILVVRSIAYRNGLLWTRVFDLSKAESYYSISGDVEILDTKSDGLTLKFKGGEGRLVPKPDAQSAWSFDFRGRKVLKLFMAGCLLSLLVLSLFVTAYGKDEFSNRRMLYQSAAVSLFASIFFTVILPIQSYLVNQSDFKFGLVALLKDVSVEFLVTFCIIMIILSILAFFWGRFFHVVLLSIVIYEYFETGVLAIGQPALNGEIGYYANLGKGLLDIGILVVLVGVSVLCWRWLKELVHWIALAFLLLSCLSIFDVHADSHKSVNMEGAVIRDFNTKLDVAKSAVYSTNRNVIVFVLDMVSSEVAEDILGQDKDLRSKFDGFTCYRNNVGMHMCTEVGSAGMLTGLYFENPATLTDYVYSVFGSNSVLSCYANADIPVYSLPGAMKFGYTNRARGVAGTSVETRQAPCDCLTWRMEDQQKWTLSEVVRFRATPFLAKAIVFGKIVSSWPNQGDIHDESQLFPILADRPVTSDCGMTLQWYHTTGTHPPLQVDRFGHVFSEARFGYDAHREKAWYAIRLLGELFDVYRRKGVYNNSMIVVCADHAASYENGGTPIKNGLPPRALPMLWVKSPKGHGSAIESDIPTSHSKLANLIMAARSRDLSRSEIDSILKTDDRLFREAAGKGLWDWHVDVVGNVKKEEISLVRSANTLKPLVSGRTYSFSSTDKGEKADVVFENVDWSGAGQPRIFDGERAAKMRFKVPDRALQYTVCFNIRTMTAQTGGRQKSDSENPKFGISANNGSPVFASFDAKTEKAVVELKDVLPDSDGIIELHFIRDGFDDQVFLVDIKIEAQ